MILVRACFGHHESIVHLWEETFSGPEWIGRTGGLCMVVSVRPPKAWPGLHATCASFDDIERAPHSPLCGVAKLALDSVFEVHMGFLRPYQTNAQGGDSSPATKGRGNPCLATSDAVSKKVAKLTYPPRSPFWRVMSSSTVLRFWDVRPSASGIHSK